MKNTLYIVVALIVALLVCAGAYFLWHPVPRSDLGTGTGSAGQEATPAQLPDNVGTYKMPAPRTPPQGAKEYYNAAYHFALLYPDTMRVKEYKEPGFSLTVTFVDPQTQYSFEVFVTPYADTTITPERFKQDEPSGVAASSTDITLAGKPAVAFYGKNATVGDTREVWIIDHGFLFEMTTYKALDQWLDQIMATWEFL